MRPCLEARASRYTKVRALRPYLEPFNWLILVVVDFDWCLWAVYWTCKEIKCINISMGFWNFKDFHHISKNLTKFYGISNFIVFHIGYKDISGNFQKNYKKSQNYDEILKNSKRHRQRSYQDLEFYKRSIICHFGLKLCAILHWCKNSVLRC